MIKRTMLYRNMAGAALISALMLGISACGSVSVIGAESSTAPQVIVDDDVTPTNPGPGAAENLVKPVGGEEENSSEDRLIDEQPVKKYGTISSVDPENGQITFLSNESVADENGALSDTVQEIVLNVGEGVPVIDAVSGMPVALSDLKEGDAAYAWVAQMMTMSLPPQTPLQALVVNIPADYAAPQYVVIKDVETDGKGAYTFTDQDGNKWSATEEGTTVTPFLTRQMIYLEGIEKGAHCMIWPGAAVTASEPPIYSAEKIMVFNF